jgi:LysM repeat protein
METADTMKAFYLQRIFPWFTVLAFLSLGWLSVNEVFAQDETPTPQVETSLPQAEAPTHSQIIEAVNALRISHGIPPLGVHPVLMQIGQQQADGIAAGMAGHWRPNDLTLGQWLISLGYPLSGDLSLDGYRSENWGFAQGAEDAIAMWLGDDEHTNTMLSLERSDIGVGIAFSSENGTYVIVVETALQTRSGKQQSDAYVIMTGIPLTKASYSDMSTQAAKNGLLPQGMLPVALNTALADGNVYHEVKYGQTLWSIAVTYKTTVKQIQKLNNMSDTIVQPGQRLLILQGATQPAPIMGTAALSPSTFSTPTVIPATVTPTPDAVKEFSAQDNKNSTLGIVSIAIAALFLGGLFAVMTRKKQI